MREQRVCKIRSRGISRLEGDRKVNKWDFDGAEEHAEMPFVVDPSIVSEQAGERRVR
jgi:P pilus assembly chaperone PapD